MKERTWTIGSLPGCDIRVDSPTVSGRHCRLTQRGQTFVLEDLASTNGTFVAGERIHEPRSVRRGEQITLGHNTPMPWPNLCSITVGRLPDNDVVVPLDVVSGRHARLEREGNRVLLIDLDSRNGTSLNDPRNKISRAAIQPGDVVFLGTHKIMAAQLLAALPKDLPAREQARQGTRTEAPPPADPGVKPSPAAPNKVAPQTPVSLFRFYRSGRSWALGMGFSAACVLVLVAASSTFRAGPKPPPFSVAKTPIAQTPAPLPDQEVHGEPTASVAAQPPRSAVAEIDEQLVRKSEKGIYLLSIRTDGLICSTGLTAWAISPDTIVCSTDVLARIERALCKGDELGGCIVVRSRSRTLRVVKHSPLDGDGAFLSVARTEAPVETVCFDSRATSAFVPEPGQKLAVLVARSRPGSGQADDPTAVLVQPITLKVEQVQRDTQQAPLAWRCTAAEDPGPAVAVPVFDGAGRVVGCVESTHKTEVRVVPIGRLATLQHSDS